MSTKAVEPQIFSKKLTSILEECTDFIFRVKASEQQ
jgi:hypothetical protein